MGNPVSYPATNTIDDNPTTAWRCDNSAPPHTPPQILTLNLGEQRAFRVTDVGLIPGYAKTDPYNGTNRFVENHTVTKVVWQFDGGLQVEQVIDNPRPEMAWVHLSTPVDAWQIQMAITQSGNPGSKFDSTAVSEVVLRGVDGYDEQ
jgi:hypothetical protein